MVWYDLHIVRWQAHYLALQTCLMRLHNHLLQCTIPHISLKQVDYISHHYTAAKNEGQWLYYMIHSDMYVDGLNITCHYSWIYIYKI